MIQRQQEGCATCNEGLLALLYPRRESSDRCCDPSARGRRPHSAVFCEGPLAYSKGSIDLDTTPHSLAENSTRIHIVARRWHSLL